VAQSVKLLPSAQVIILGFWDQAPCWAPSSVGSLLLSLPLPPIMLSRSPSISNNLRIQEGEMYGVGVVRVMR